ncbi:hypothetical protein QBC33DRAFT_377470 [Phialemonium atrogriseum]|uniref:F-box domain-containing protein n=1 Tax=Phialemonium atrogriseum TaxID=1093897 RepID=A0AAJ0C4C0_9PEZI|nr:uncharacterized protein QBC33DRAFT_377470 [Phialemonium atrogriseum]KAK1768442.1 hypothetical protein QBC33DRAFT_377470 [Phialemonium atrogriseum]
MKLLVLFFILHSSFSNYSLSCPVTFADIMGQTQSVRGRRCQSSLPSTGSGGSAPGSAPWSAFMQLPVDLVLLISDSFLDPISALALSLTCKDLFNMLFVKPLPRLENSDQEAFLLLLEKDVSRQRPRYYCHACVRLHSFDPTREGPTTSDYGRALEYNDCRRSRAYLDGGEFTIGYHHARLIMNQHLYGAPQDLALSAFDITYRPGDYPQQGLALSAFDITHRPGDYLLRWGQQWSARIIDDELFLSATHTLRFDGTEGDFRDMLDQRKYNVCAYVGTKKHADRRSREHAEKCHGYRQHLYDSRNQMLQRRGDAHLASPLWFNPPWSPSRTINSFRREGSASLPQHRFLRQCRDLLGRASSVPPIIQRLSLEEMLLEKGQRAREKNGSSPLSPNTNWGAVDRRLIRNGKRLHEE